MSNKTEIETQGHIKMLRYIEDLIRNRDFKSVLKKLRRSSKNNDIPVGSYCDWTPEQQKKHDYINDELGSIIHGYELLRKRCKRIMRDKNFIYREEIASYYGLDHDLLDIAILMIKKEENIFPRATEPADMCKLMDVYDEEMNPENKGDEIIYLNLSRQTTITAYPVAVGIHPKASKRDVLDYIEKRWKWIDSALRSAKQKPLRIRKRKYSLAMTDFIWENRNLPAKMIKERLDKKYPKNGFVYYEISKIIQLENIRRDKII